MKQLFSLILMLAVTSVGFSQGVKKSEVAKVPAKAAVKTVAPAQDSIVVHGTYKTDTVKVIAVVYVEDGSVAWTKGYTIVRSFVPQGGQPQAVAQYVTNAKFEAIKPEDIFDIRQVDWK